MTKIPAHYPRRSAGKTDDDLEDYPDPIPPQWQLIAEAKGFVIIRRVTDRYHVVLQCRACDGLTVSKVFTLRTARPRCGACHDTAIRDTATAARLAFLRRDSNDRHYGIYRAACGHEIRRQFELVQRIAAGTVEARCETCQDAIEAAKAQARGWTLVGRDPDDDPNYRFYRHDPCGHERRIARANMLSGRCRCHDCTVGTGDWRHEPNFIYMMALDLEGLGPVIKLGHSCDPVGRMRYQLDLDRSRPAEVIRTVPFPTGLVAMTLERSLHAQMRLECPGLQVSRDKLDGRIGVVSEIYLAEAEPILQAMLDALGGPVADGTTGRSSDPTTGPS